MTSLRQHPNIESLERVSLRLFQVWIGGPLIIELFIDPTSIVNLLELVLVLAVVFYLRSGWLRQHLGKSYLPLLLAVYSVSIIGLHWAGLFLVRDWLPSAFEQIAYVFVLFSRLIVVGCLIGVLYSQNKATVSFIAFSLLMIAFIMVQPATLDISKWNLITPVLWLAVFSNGISWILTSVLGQQRVLQHELEKKNALLAEYVASAERLAVSRERNRMARDLHDTLAHTLSAFAVQLEAIDKQIDRQDVDGAKARIKQTRTLVRSGLTETRRALQALRASPLEDLGFKLAISQLVSLMDERSNMQIKLEMIGDLNDLRPDIEQSVYRIAEEALNNANRHANAKNMAISFTRHDNILRLFLQDDGVGFDPQSVSDEGHYGLKGMRERAILCNGQLSIDSQPGKGTKVSFEVEV